MELNPDGKLERVLNEKAGIPADSVTFAYPDREGGLWMTHIAGVTRALTPGPLSFFNGSTGIKGFAAALARQQDVLYAGTSAGLDRLARHRRQASPRNSNRFRESTKRSSRCFPPRRLCSRAPRAGSIRFRAANRNGFARARAKLSTI